MSGILEILLAMWKNEPLPHSLLSEETQNKQTRPIAVQEVEDIVSDSEDEVFTLEHIGTVKHQKKGQFYVP